MTTISDNELKAIAINAMGRASEGGFAAVRKLGLADNVKNGIVHSGSQSGYTIGDIQWDIGAKEDKDVAKDLLHRYNTWAKMQNNSDYPQENLDNNVTLLMQHGHQYSKKDLINKKPRPEIELLNGKPDLRQSPLGHHLDAYLKTPDGIAFGRELTERQCKTDLVPAMHKAMAQKSISSKLESNNPEKTDEARKILAMVSKITNQYGSFPKSLNPILDIADLTPETFLNKIKDHFRSHKDKNGKEVENAVVISVKATMKGADLYNTLNHDNGYLGTTFKKQMQLDPTLLKSEMATNPENEVLDAMFRNPDAAQKLIHAYNNGSAYQIDNHHGRIKDEAYTIGVNKEGQIYSVDKTGKGFCLERNSNDWHELNSLQDINVDFHNHQNKSHNHNTVHADAQGLFDQIKELTQREAKKFAINWGQGMENTAYTLAAAAMENGLKQVTHLALSEDNKIINIADLSADRHLYAKVNVKVAAETETSKNLERINQIVQYNEQEKLNKQMQPQKIAKEQTYSSPTMKV